MMISLEKINELLLPFDVHADSCESLHGYISENYKVTNGSGKNYVLKYYNNPSDFDLVYAEAEIIRNISGKISFRVPDVIPAGDTLLQKYPDGSFSRLMPFIEGRFFAEADHTEKILFNIGKAAAGLDAALTGLKNPVIESRELFWDIRQYRLSLPRIKCITDPGKRKLVDYFFDQFEYFAFPRYTVLRHSIIHNDFNDWNVLTDGENITGLLDFGDITYAPLVSELAITITYSVLSKENPVAAAVKIIEGYQSVFPLTEEEIRLLYYLIPARLCISVCSSALAKTEGKDTDYILVSEKPAWELLEKWIRYNPVYITNEFLKAAGYIPDNAAHKYAIASAQRKKYFSPALSLSYKDPIQMSAAAFQYMYDTDGNTYLDAYNNIPLVGHCHPRVSGAVANQVRILNTNTRYYYDSLGEYAEKLLGYFPEKLNKIFFVNSGSAATDLAIRLAKNFTERDHMLVLEHGYHGNTQSGIDLSAYKFDGKGGKGEPALTHKLPLPNAYNGIFSSGTEYANDAIKKIESLIAEKKAPAAFIAEMISGCGGQVPLAPGYMKTLFPFLQKNNILFISDEVQTGFGRLGHYFWGFEMHKAIPDLVILGKPMGNGHPIAAVVTTTEIADAFATGMEFFSSFGGNPVSCEAGKAVLEVLEEEQLQKAAAETGDYYIFLLKELQKKFPVIGDVRGSGLFLGVEFVTEKNEPATALAAAVINGLKEQFILTSTDGPFNNVLKTKPPLCFSKGNAEEMTECLGKILESLHV